MLKVSSLTGYARTEMSALRVSSLTTRKLPGLQELTGYARTYRVKKNLLGMQELIEYTHNLPGMPEPTGYAKTYRVCQNLSGTPESTLPVKTYRVCQNYRACKNFS